ncbi:MAG: hypothetical protein CBB87_08115 [Micavibrio sp. TMED27]|nr:hypothetical protein [Micavibrio sp.]OUT90635.1 MAG: hypothetical protein CBB87_08115 [Micavibrio sp. TMED27]|tara:strand:- start:1055 stop:1243 length:189 start_codon:yes stop_codon:yes gene_type:complete
MRTESVLILKYVSGREEVLRFSSVGEARDKAFSTREIPTIEARRVVSMAQYKKEQMKERDKG